MRVQRSTMSLCHAVSGRVVSCGDSTFLLPDFVLSASVLPSHLSHRPWQGVLQTATAHVATKLHNLII